MEERHYVSQPRPVPDLELPTWEVDIMREGVDTPIMTFNVDNNILPPRKRKKRVIWKLPETLDILPKFGTEDKKRILDIFKQRKKELKRQRKSQTINQQSTNENTAPNGTVKKEKPSTQSISSPSIGAQNKETLNGHAKTAATASPPPPGFTFSQLSISTEGANGALPEQPSTPTQTNKIHNKIQDLEGNDDETKTEPLPSSQPIKASHPPPPPGLPPQPSGRLTNTSIPSHQFIVPENSTLAQVVTEVYYLLLMRGMIQELSEYYAPTAQKSLTVGGAHAICTHMEQRQQQLKSLAGMVVNIKGVLQQPTVDGATLVLITGTCVQPYTLPFCHSLVLAPSMNGGFQIQNDALCLLTSED